MDTDKNADETCWVVIHGVHTSAKSAPDYVEHIVYGEPVIYAVTVGSHFVALCRWDEQNVNAKYTFERMASFPHGAQLTFDVDHAWREFGIWVAHYAPEPTSVTTRRMQQLAADRAERGES